MVWAVCIHHIHYHHKFQNFIFKDYSPELKYICYYNFEGL